MTLLAEDLLDLTKAESLGPDAAVEPLQLRALVVDVLERLHTAAEKKSVTLACDVLEGEVVEADRNSLGQIMANLVDNAIKYTPDGGGAVRVWTEYASGNTAIRVTDNGIGIPAEDLPRIFERFYRVNKDRSRQSGGTGLGLAIVKHLCEQMGASVSVKSEVGLGTTFSVILGR